MTLFTKLNKLTIYDVNKYQTAKFVYLFYKGLLPYSFKSIFILINKIHQYRTRNEGNFFLHGYKTNVRKLTISIAGPNLWKSIPC